MINLDSLKVSLEIEMLYGNKERNKVWAFCSGQYSNDFRGNPKYLFVYVNRYRTDICAYWLCENREVVELVRSMGYQAYMLGTLEAEKAVGYTGVLVAEQVKMSIPAGLENAVYLNLWHGVGGIKPVERSMTTGKLAGELAKKYISMNAYYRMNELYLSPCPLIDSIAKEQLGLEEKQIIRAGYPRCLYQKNYEPVKTYEHNLFKRKKLPEDTKIAAYTPTYRMEQKGELFGRAVPDLERLISVCEENHILLIFKMHPVLENETGFLEAKKSYGSCPWLLFWENQDDFYEIMDQVDLCIMDYSSIFTDFIAVGVKHFLRYVFDLDEIELDFPLGYDEATLGRKCVTFEELLDALCNYERDDLTEDLKRIGNLYWEYSGKDSMDHIVDSTLKFVPERKKFPNLYSFDIFDTLIERKTLEPEAIFYYVKEKMKENNIGWPEYLLEHYPEIRKNAEANVREYYNRSMVEREDERCEIQFDEILDRIAVLFHLTEDQKTLLGKWEMDGELENVQPVIARIEEVKKLTADGQTVVLVSDMYLPRFFLRMLLEKADPFLKTLPLFLSSEAGYQKSRGTLYLEIYRSYGAAYSFGRWIHTGDNILSDGKMARAMNIETVLVEKPELNEFEKAFVEYAQSYDAYLAAALSARFRYTHKSKRAYFAYAYISMLFVPYIEWALRSCKEEQDEVVYFISRDGHQLKRIADVINEEEQLGLDLKYIYASRKTWRIPSFYQQIDVGFWGQGYGNLARVDSFDSLLAALDLSEEDFRRIFPELSRLDAGTKIDGKEIVRLAQIFKNSRKYEEYLLGKAKEERIPVCGYLRQEMDTARKSAVIEYWGRGYTQENFTRLWQDIKGEKEATTFYYSRSTLPSDADNIRRNYTSHPSSQAFIESIFACINYRSVEGYQRKGGKWVPVTGPADCDMELFRAMEEYLPVFAGEYCCMPFLDREKLGRTMMDFAITWYSRHQDWEYFTEILAKLTDSVELYGDKAEYAKRLTMSDLDRIRKGATRGQISKSIPMSYGRAAGDVQKRFREMFQIREGEDLTSGWKISEAEMKQNQQAKERLEKLRKENAEFEQKYHEAVNRAGVLPKVLVITEGKAFGTIEWGSLQEALGRQDKLEAEWLALGAGKLRKEEVAEKLAQARFVLLTHPIELLSGLKLRQGSFLIIIRDTPMQYFRNGAARQWKLRYEKELNDLRVKNDISAVVCASEKAAENVGEIYQLDERTEKLMLGCCQTDCYLNAELRAQLRTKLNYIFPEAVHKKVICYAPYYRSRNAKSGYAEMLDMSILQKELGSEYVVIMNLMGSAKEIPNFIELGGFSMDLTEAMPLREQLLAADVVVADYRDTTFEAALLGIPVFNTCRDARRFDAGGNAFCNFEEMLFGTPVSDSQELAGQLKTQGQREDFLTAAFRQKYLKYCDGNSAANLVGWLLKKNEAEKGGEAATIGDSINVRPALEDRQPEIFWKKLLEPEDGALYWDSVRGAVGYEVYDAGEEEGVYQKCAEAGEIERCFHVPADRRGRWYKVRAYSEGKECLGMWSESIRPDRQDGGALSLTDEMQKPEVLCCVTDAKGGVRIYWTGDDRAAGWRIYRVKGGTEEIIEEIPHLCTWEYRHKSGTDDPDTGYCVEALYRLEDGTIADSGLSEQSSLQRTLSVKPQIVKFAPEGAVLKWNEVEGAEGYRLYRKDGIRASYVPIADIAAGEERMYLDKGVPEGVVRYILQVTAESGKAASGPLKCEVPGRLERPGGLIVSRGAEGSAELLWDAADSVSGFHIRRCTQENRKGELIAEVSADVTWWKDRDVSSDVIGYSVEAFLETKAGTAYSGYCKMVRM